MQLRLAFAFALCLGSLPSGARAGAGLPEITSKNFASTVEGSDELWMLEFYSDMCGSCKEFKPTFEALAAKFEGQIKSAGVNIDHSDGMALANQLGILSGGIPNISLFGKAVKAQGEDYMVVMKGAPQGLAELTATVAEMQKKLGA